MAHKRSIQPAALATGNELTAAMIGIGMAFTGKAAKEPNIEDTLLAAAYSGMEDDDLRVLSVLTTWFGVHAPYVIASRLVKIVEACDSKRVRAYFAALAQWQSNDHRFAPLAGLRPSRRVDLLRSGTSFQVRRRGEDSRFQGTALRVPAGALRSREADVEGPSALAKRHRSYRWRIIIGPGFRADMWAALESKGGMSAAELARSTYGSFASAWRVRRDFVLLHAAPPRRTRA